MVFLVNLGIVLYLGWLLAVNHRKKVLTTETACREAVPMIWW